MSAKRALTLSLAGLMVAGSLGAAEVVILNNDAPGVGLNDTTPATPIAGNMGTTLGEQRLNVLLRAAEIWADELISDVPITIRAQTALQQCDANGAVLASAGAAVVFRNFQNAPFANTWYHGALANSIAGVDLDVNNPDIQTQFNLNLDEDPNCLGGNGWYYGFDNNEGAAVDLLATMLHEYGHGLGFANFANEAAGTLFQNTPDVYTTFTRDLETGMNWNDMTNAERVASAINDPDVVWTGATVSAAIGSFLDGTSIVTVDTPPAIAGTSDVQPAAFGPPVPGSGLSGTVVAATDGIGASPTDGCEALTNGAAINGNIALIDRGTCNFTVKVINAQAVGAVGVLIANNVPDGLPPMGGDDPAVAIPSVGISQALGADMNGQLPTPGVTITLGTDDTRLAGANSGFLRVHAPVPVAPGSSISHWTTDATPSLLMEPAITPDLTDDVDLTLELFTDIGWSLNEVFSADFERGDCDEWTSTSPGGCS
ncbi:MAG: PA domain-containing protein [Acidobacteriota bacterium]